MANVQIVRNQPTETLNQTIVTQQQSLDVVKTMLHGGVSRDSLRASCFADHSQLSCITYLRYVR